VGKIKDLPKEERPREKALLFGIETLSDEEILAMLIGSGYLGVNAKEIANKLLIESRGLFYLANKPIQYLKSFKGIGPSSALKIAACFELAKRYKFKSSIIENDIVSTNKIVERYAPKIMGYSQEVFIIVILNKKKEIIHEETLYKGTEFSLETSHNDILRCLVLNRGRYYYLIHNHPNGSLFPSSADMIFTDDISMASKKLHFEMVDHIIISESGYFSFLENPNYGIKENE